MKKALIACGIMLVFSVMSIFLLLNAPKLSDVKVTPDPVEAVTGRDTQPTKTPAVPSPSPVSSPERADLTITFGGDVLLARGVAGLLDQKDGYAQVISPALAEQFAQSDLTLVNLELPFSKRGKAAEDKEYTFRGDPAHLAFLTYLGIDAVTLANNHMLDFGVPAMEDTLTELDKAGIGHVGAGGDLAEAMKPFTKTVLDKKIAFLGATRVVPKADWHAGEERAGLFTTYDPKRLNAAIAQARKDSDIVIVYVHWGKEMRQTPEGYQTELAHGFIDAGADAVIGSHPHVLQGVEFYKGKFIAYSLGNFVFTDAERDTMTLRLTFKDDKIEPLLQFCRIKNLKTAPLEDQDAKEDIRKQLEKMSVGVSIDENGVVRAK